MTATTRTTRSPRSPRAAVYSRLSVVGAEESVSLERQRDSATKLAESRHWNVTHYATPDDGVSASKQPPQDRPGWQEILTRLDDLDIVVIWKLERAFRNTLDFLETAKVLQAHDVALVAVEDPVDLSTAQGKVVATVLAAFAEFEAQSTAARVKAARSFMVTEQGRHPAGDAAWPFTKTPNPDGDGYVLRPIPERADAVRDAAQWILGGVSLSEVARRWTAAGYPTAGKPRKDRHAPQASWSRTSVKQVMCNPRLTGVTILRGEPLRNKDGTVMVDLDRVILDRMTFDLVQKALKAAPRGRRPVNLPLLHGIARCSSCGQPLAAHRPTGKRPSTYRCQNRECTRRVTIGMTILDEHVTHEFLTKHGSHPLFSDVTLTSRPDKDIAAVKAALADIAEAFPHTDRDHIMELFDRREALQERLDDLEAGSEDKRVYRRVDLGTTAAEAFTETEDVTKRRMLIDHFLRSVDVTSGIRGRRGFDPDRVLVRSNPDADGVLPAAA